MLSKANFLLLALNLIFASLLSRIDSLFPGHDIELLFDLCRIMGFFISLPLLWKASRETVLWQFAIGALILLHSWCSLYQPALRVGVKPQDWLLAGLVSSNYSFAQFKTYFFNVFLLISPMIVALQNSGKEKKRMIDRTIVILLFCLAVNVVVALIQGVVDLKILADGSGSAVTSGRAPALLEDSGASTVYFSSILSAVIAMTLFSLKTTIQRLIAMSLLLFMIWAASFSAGRTFFISLGLTATILILAKGFDLLRTDSRLRISRFALVTSALVMFALYLVRNNTSTLQPLLNLVSLLASGEWEANQVANALDHTRKIHWLTMVKTWIDNPIFGSGFGMFYSNFFQNLGWAKLWGGDAPPDVPTSFYLLLLSEAGIAGLLMIGYWLTIQWLNFKSLKNLLKNGSDTRLAALSLGLGISLTISFFVGTHIIFRSVSVTAALLIAINSDSSKVRSLKTLRILGFLIGGFLIAGIIKKVATAPPEPEFFWSINHVPQIPLGINVPIAPPYPGRWLQSGVELAVTKKDIEIFIERPVQLYPAKVKIKVKLKNGKFFEESQTVDLINPLKPGSLMVFKIPEELIRCCLNVITPQDYCSMKISVSPEWIHNGKEVGYFMGMK